MKIATLLLVTAIACSSYAVGVNQRVEVEPRLRPDRFVKQLLGEPAVPKARQSATVLYAQRYAEGYLDGVIDSTRGSRWCAPARMSADEFDDRIVAGLKQHSSSSRHDTAADALIEQLSQKYPCR
jgi:hypothetical protein